MPHANRRPTTFVPTLLLSLALASCHARFHSSSSYSHRYQDRGDHIQLDLHDDGVERHAELRRESSGEIEVFRVERLEPWYDEDPASLGWLFRYLRPNIELRLADGTIVPHPDLATSAALREQLEQDLEGTLRELPRLVRHESRSALFAEAAGRATSGADLDLLVQALEAGGPLTADCPEGPINGRSAAGGSRSTSMHTCMTVLASHPTLDTARADALAGVVDQLQNSRREAEVLSTLIPKATAGAIVDAAVRIDSSKSRFRVFERLAAQDLGARDADRLAAAVDRIGSSRYEAAVLTALIPSASQDAIVAAARRIDSSKSRYQVLLALGSHPGLSTADADRIAKAADSIGSSSQEAEVLRALVARASNHAIVEAAVKIDSSSRRAEVLQVLATRGALSQADADRIAAAVDDIGSSSSEAKVLLALLPHASHGAIAAAAVRIDASSGRYQVLHALARRPQLSQRDADQVASAAERIRSSSYESKVLRELVGKASVSSLLQACRSIDSSGSRREVLDALVASPDLGVADADRLVAEAARITSSTDKTRLLLALVGRAADEKIRKVAARLPSSNRAQVLDALLLAQGR
jgi:hypothetical protein